MVTTLIIWTWVITLAASLGMYVFERMTSNYEHEKFWQILDDIQCVGAALLVASLLYRLFFN